jgi:hypothetical protein
VNRQQAGGYVGSQQYIVKASKTVNVHGLGGAHDPVGHDDSFREKVAGLPLVKTKELKILGESDRGGCSVFDLDLSKYIRLTK